MANYDIPDYPIKRLRYFNNQFLVDQDFIDDDASQIAHERAFLRSLCVAGVCEGLQVTYPAANKPPSVSAGVAVDKTGRMIVIGGATDALAKPDALSDGDYFVHISFLETEDDKASGQGAPDFTRWKQTPVINATAKTTALPDGAIVLGSCTVQNKAFVGAGTTAGRQYSGLRLPGPNKDVTATLRNPGAADDLAMLGGSLTLRRDAAGQLGPTLTILNGLGGAGAGGAIDFDGYDPGANDPALRMRSLDDGNFSSHLTFATKQPGAATNKLVERLRITSDGLLRFPNESPKDKLVLSDNGAADRYGLGLNGSNINLFCPPTARLSLRQNSSTGAEVFTVTGAGDGNFTGNLTISGTRLKNSTGLGIIETNQADWLRINPDQQYPGIALHKPVAVGTGGLSVGDWTQLPQGQLRVTGAATFLGSLSVAGAASTGSLSVSGSTTTGSLNVTGSASVAGILQISGSRLRNSGGFGIVETNATDWLRVNPDQQYPGIAMYKPVAIGTGGLSVGDWSQLPQGQLRVTGAATLVSGALVGSIGIGGGNTYGAVSWPYETIQMNPAHNFRIWFGTTERFLVSNSGAVTIRFAQGYWAFQTDGNLVKYNNANQALWALNLVNGHAGW
jgi:hypothetical protein